MTTGSAALEISGLTRRFGALAAVDDVTLHVPAGQLCVIVGPSGCGKSTLLRMVAGLEPADGGTIRIAGEDVSLLSPRQRDVAFVFQSYALYPHMSVRENLEFPLKVRGVGRVERRARAEEAAEMLGISELLERRPRQLSGGQRQRVAVGRAVVRKPRLFLFDEPLSNLDARFRTRMRVELAELLRRLGTTTVYVTHDQAEAMTLGQQVAVMRSGRLLQTGTPRDIYERPADPFTATFFGSPPMNLIPGTIERAASGAILRWSGGEIAAPAALAPGAAVVGIRPEHLALRATGPIALTVRVVEDLGADRFAHGTASGTELVARLDPDAPSPRDGDTVRLGVDDRRLHWFQGDRRIEVADPKEGERQ